MIETLNLEILTKTFDDLPTGVGIFQVEDFDDLKSIKYIYMNKIVLYEMRKTKEEVFGKRIIEVAPEAYEHEGGLLVMETYRNIARDGGSIDLGIVEYSNQMVAGKYECSIHHIQDNYVYIMLRNVTELEETKNELERKNQELRQMTNIVSHDLKDPVNTISSIVELVEDLYKTKLDDQGRELLSLISSSTGRMRNLITDLLDYGELGKEKENIPIDLNEIFKIIQTDLSVRIKDTQSKIEVSQLPTINGNRAEIRVMFQNLISNAMKFCAKGVIPEINVYSKESNDSWTISISDNGIGISEENKAKVFNMFERMNGKNYEGSGIGLAHCKKIIDLHGGEISLDSKLGEGSTFHIKLPK